MANCPGSSLEALKGWLPAELLTALLPRFSHGGKAEGGRARAAKATPLLTNQHPGPHVFQPWPIKRLKRPIGSQGTKRSFFSNIMPDAKVIFLPDLRGAVD